MSNDPLEHNSEADEKSFADILNEFESATRAPRRETTRTSSRGRGRGKQEPRNSLRGTVVGISGDYILIDHGAKSEGVIPRHDLLDAAGNLGVKVGDTFDVAITGFNPEGMAKLSRVAGQRPRDWGALSQAFETKGIVAGRVTGMVKGGFTVDVGGRAFLPASRSGVRDSAEMEKLVGQEIRCRIIKLDADDEDIVVDRRSVMEEEAEEARRNRLETLEEGATVRGTVRSLTNYGAFLDVGGIDGLLHVGDMTWSRVADPATEMAVGDELEVKVLKVDKQAGKVSLGLKQLTPDPWGEAVAKLKPGDRVTGEVTRLMDFGAFVQIMPGVEGLIHVSEMSWTRRVQRASDVLKLGEHVEAVVLKVDAAATRLSLGLKQVLGNPWDTLKDRFPAGKVIEGKVTRLAKFGAFVEVEEGVDGLVHISEFTSEKRIQTPGEIVKVGQVVRAVIVSADPETKRLKLSMKQLEATPTDQFVKDVSVGDQITGRVTRVRGNEVTVQLGEGIEGFCMIAESGASEAPAAVAGASLAEQLAAAWKGGVKPAGKIGGSEPYVEGQLRSFTIKAVDSGAGKKIELKPA
jgi:small subunit ribosomal protein S1